MAFIKSSMNPELSNVTIFTKTGTKSKTPTCCFFSKLGSDVLFKKNLFK